MPNEISQTFTNFFNQVFKIPQAIGNGFRAAMDAQVEKTVMPIISQATDLIDDPLATELIHNKAKDAIHGKPYSFDISDKNAIKSAVVNQTEKKLKTPFELFSTVVLGWVNELLKTAYNGLINFVSNALDTILDLFVTKEENEKPLSEKGCDKASEPHPALDVCSPAFLPAMAQHSQSAVAHDHDEPLIISSKNKAKP